MRTVIALISGKHVMIAMNRDLMQKHLRLASDWCHLIWSESLLTWNEFDLITDESHVRRREFDLNKSESRVTRTEFDLTSYESTRAVSESKAADGRTDREDRSLVGRESGREGGRLRMDS